MAIEPQNPGAEESGQLTPSAEAMRANALVLANPSNQAVSLNARSQDADENEDEFDLLGYWRILVKRRWIVFSTIAMVLVLALVSTLLTTPLYRSSTTLQIERDSMQVVQVEGVNSPTYGSSEDFDYSFYQTQFALLQSRALASRVSSQMRLAETEELDRLWPQSPWSRLKSLFVGSHKEGTAKPHNAKSDTERRDAATASFESGIDIVPVRKSRLVTINYDSPDAVFSQRAANALAESFIAMNLERRFESASYATSYLEDRLQELKLKLEDSERKLVAFAVKEQIVGTDDQPGHTSLSQQGLLDLSSAYVRAQQERIQTEARWEQAKNLHGVSLYRGTSADSVMQQLMDSRSRLMADYQDKLRLYKPDYPLMQQMHGQIEEISKQIIAEETDIRAGIHAEYESALRQEQMLATQLTELKGEALDLQNRSIQYNVYKREVDTNRQLYDALLQRYKTIGVAGGVSANNISIIDRAEEGYKFKPSMSRNLSLAMLFGSILGVMLALAFEYLDDTFKRPEDIETLLGLSVLGTVPLLKTPSTPASAMEDVRSVFSESYRSLCTALQFSTGQGVPRSLLVTSAMPSEGKSTTALVMAKYYTQLGKRVLIIDCDLRNPSLHKLLRVENNAGLSNFLAGSGKVWELVRPTDLSGLSYLPTGPLPPNPAELLMGSKMMSLLTVAIEKFDLVVLDGPPVLGLADAPILANMARGTLLVVQAGRTRIPMARNALKRLQTARGHVIGALLTHFQSQHAGSAYGYGYGSYSSYYAYGGKQLTKQ